MSTDAPADRDAGEDDDPAIRPVEPSEPAPPPLRALEPLVLPVEREPLIGSRGRRRIEPSSPPPAFAEEFVEPSGHDDAGPADQGIRKRRFSRLFGDR